MAPDATVGFSSRASSSRGIATKRPSGAQLTTPAAVLESSLLAQGGASELQAVGGSEEAWRLALQAQQEDDVVTLPAAKRSMTGGGGGAGSPVPRGAPRSGGSTATGVLFGAGGSGLGSPAQQLRTTSALLERGGAHFNIGVGGLGPGSSQMSSPSDAQARVSGSGAGAFAGAGPMLQRYASLPGSMQSAPGSGTSASGSMVWPGQPLLPPPGPSGQQQQQPSQWQLAQQQQQLLWQPSGSLMAPAAAQPAQEFWMQQQQQQHGPEPPGGLASVMEGAADMVDLLRQLVEPEGGQQGEMMEALAGGGAPRGAGAVTFRPQAGLQARAPWSDSALLTSAAGHTRGAAPHQQPLPPPLQLQYAAQPSSGGAPRFVFGASQPPQQPPSPGSLQ